MVTQYKKIIIDFNVIFKWNTYTTKVRKLLKSTKEIIFKLLESRPVEISKYGIT